MSKARNILIKTSESGLVFANSGKGFDCAGVISICAAYLSAKQPYKLDVPGGPDSELISRVRDKELKTYNGDRHRLFEDFNNEKEISLDYGGRSIFELLQNADDAMAPRQAKPAELIGMKGIGFKSVLEITDEPEVHSGPFHFCFSGKKTAEYLEKQGIKDAPPIRFRIPHSSAPRKEIEELLRAYKTAIYLPFRDDQAADRCRRMVNEITTEHLLFCQNIKNLRIELEDRSWKEWKTVRNAVGLSSGEIVVEYRTSSSDEKQKTRWRRWADTFEISQEESKRGSVAFCLPWVNGKPSPHVLGRPKGNRLWVFLPTENQLPFNALIHASFDLDQGRKHTRGLDDTKAEAVFNHMEALFVRVLEDLKDYPETIISYFVPNMDIDEESNNADLPARLWESFRSKLEDFQFIPYIGGGVTHPRNIKLWKHNLGDVIDRDKISVKDIRLLPGDWDKESKERLARIGARDLGTGEYLEALECCFVNGSLTSAKAIKVLCRVLEEEKTINWHWREYVVKARTLPIWWTDRDRARPLESDYPFFLACPKELEYSWASYEVIHPELKKLLEEKEGNSPHSWFDRLKSLNLVGDYLLESSGKNIIDHVLLPVLDDIDWKAHGREILEAVKRYSGVKDFGRTSPTPWEEEQRESLCRKMRVPVKNGEWQPAWQTYASESWGGHENLEQCFSKRVDRFMLAPPDDWPGGRVEVEEWKGFLRYMGVSWEPKILPVEREVSSWSIPGLKDPFSENVVSNELWEEYKVFLQEQDQVTHESDGRGRDNFTVVTNWCLDGFPHSLSGMDLADSFAMLKELWPDIKKLAFKFKAFPSKGPGKHTGHKCESKYSLLRWQLEREPWINLKGKSLLCRDRPRFSPYEVFLSGEGLTSDWRNLIPVLGFDEVKEPQQRRELQNFAREMGVREDLRSVKPEQWRGWLQSLPGALDDSRPPLKEEQAQIICKMVYRAFLRQEFSEEDGKTEFPWKLAVLSWISKGGTAFFSSEQVCYLDDDIFTPLKEPLIRNGTRIFVCELDKLGVKLKSRLGILPLSDVMEVEDIEAEEVPTESHRIKELITERARVLSLRTELESSEKARFFGEMQKKVQIIVADNVRVIYRWQDGTQRYDPISVPFLWLQEKRTLYVSHSDQALFFNLAAGLAKIAGAPTLQSDFEHLLQEGPDAIIRRLRSLGISEDRLKGEEVLVTSGPSGPLTEERDSGLGGPAGPKKVDTGGRPEATPRSEGPSDIEGGRPSPPYRGGSVSWTPVFADIAPIEQPTPEGNGAGGGGSPGLAEEFGTAGEERVEEILKRPEWLQRAFSRRGLFGELTDEGVQRISASVNRMPKGHPGYDIEIEDWPGRGKVYVEVKSHAQASGSFSLNLSEPQFEHAVSNPDNYDIWFVSASATETPIICGPHSISELSAMGVLKKREITVTRTSYHGSVRILQPIDNA